MDKLLNFKEISLDLPVLRRLSRLTIGILLIIRFFITKEKLSIKILEYISIEEHQLIVVKETVEMLINVLAIISLISILIIIITSIIYKLNKGRCSNEFSIRIIYGSKIRVFISLYDIFIINLIYFLITDSMIIFNMIESVESNNLKVIFRILTILSILYYSVLFFKDMILDFFYTPETDYGNNEGDSVMNDHDSAPGRLTD